MTDSTSTAFTFLHPLSRGDEALPEAFTFPFRYTPHPLCRRAAEVVEQRLCTMGIAEGKMYGVMLVADGDALFFMAAYSGQLLGSYDHPWWVPPVVDYLDPNGHFQQEQQSIVAIGEQMAALRNSTERSEAQARVAALRSAQHAAIDEARRVYAEGKARREVLRAECADKALLIRESQHQKADIHRARLMHADEIARLERKLATVNAEVSALTEERKRRSEALQQWLFRQFDFLNARHEHKNLIDIFGDARRIPSGAGECCAPKLLQTAYRLGLKPLAMAEFWWGASSTDHYREPGAFFPACRSKCYPILGHMLQGLNVEPDPALHYDQKVLAPVRVLWEDEEMAVVVKPEGWVSIPGKSHQPCLMDECYRRWPDISGPVIVHRLDMDTSGVMVIAKNTRAHRALSQQFERREVEKRYIALVEGDLSGLGDGVHTISLPIAPDVDNLPRRRVDRVGGKEAVTRFEVLGVERRPSAVDTSAPVPDVCSRIAFYPQTGRTHQLRVHAAATLGLAAPILGDRLYGHPDQRLYLHAEAITLKHPLTLEQLHFEAPCPF